MKTESGEFLIVGSNNLTGAAISSNHELATSLERCEYSDEASPRLSGLFRLPEGASGLLCAWRNVLRRIPSDADLRGELCAWLASQKLTVPEREIRARSSSDHYRAGSFGEFLHLLAEEFPKLNQSQKGRVKAHPLKRMNDEEFKPLFAKIVAEASQGRLEGFSQLDYGRWYRIPNIFAHTDVEREPYEKVDGPGRLTLQIHFSDDYARAYFSIVLMFNVSSQSRMERCLTVSRGGTETCRTSPGFADTVIEDAPVFLHWIYDKDHALWSKPILTFAYEIEALPSDDRLLADLTTLAKAISGAMAIT